MEAPEPVDQMLFRYYAEQSRHTEALRLEFTKFFAGLVSGLAVAGGFLLQNATDGASIVRLVAVAGMVVSLVAAGTLWMYQAFIEQWVLAKNSLESELLEHEARVDLSPLRAVRPLSRGRSLGPRMVIVLPFVAMALAFAGLASFPGLFA